jgi:hypothetical protein
MKFLHFLFFTQYLFIIPCYSFNFDAFPYRRSFSSSSLLTARRKMFVMPSNFFTREENLFVQERLQQISLNPMILDFPFPPVNQEDVKAFDILLMKVRDAMSISQEVAFSTLASRMDWLYHHNVSRFG